MNTDIITSNTGDINTNLYMPNTSNYPVSVIDDEVEYVIPKGFQFDGASIPKFLHTWLSPTGVLLMGGLVHDYAYKYATLRGKDGGTWGKMNQKEADQIFRNQG